MAATKKKPKPPAAQLAHISADLRALAVPIETVAPDPKNKRLHTTEQMRTLRALLRRFGQRKPIVCNRKAPGSAELVTEAGAGVLEAGRQLGWAYIAVSRESDDAATAEAYGVADNRSNELSDWKTDELGAYLQSLTVDDLELVGFDENDVAGMLDAVEGNGSSSTQATGATTFDSDPPTGYRIIVSKHDDKPMTEKQRDALIEKLKKDGYTCRRSNP